MKISILNIFAVFLATAGIIMLSNYQVEKWSRKAYAQGCKDRVENDFESVAEANDMLDPKDMANFRQMLIYQCDRMANDFDMKELNET